MVARLRTTRSGRSLRTHVTIAVDATIVGNGSVRAACGITTALGSRANRIMQKPMAAFQKPTASHGVVMPNSTSSRRSTTPKPPAASVRTARTRSSAIVSVTSARKTRRRAKTRRSLRKGALGKLMIPSKIP